MLVRSCKRAPADNFNGRVIFAARERILTNREYALRSGVRESHYNRLHVVAAVAGEKSEADRRDPLADTP